MPLNDRALRIVEQADRVLDGIERQTMTAMEVALQTSYNRLEAELLAKYRQNADNLDLLPNQRKLLILGQLKNNLDLIDGSDANNLKAQLANALKQSSEEGAALANALAKSIGNEDLGNFDAIPLEALRFQAEQGVDRLIQHGQAFAGRASSIVEIGLTTGAGPKKVAAELRKQLGVTKGRAVAIARTETLSSHNQAAQAAYQRAGLEYFQLISTQDARTCPYCAARNMQVYKIGESSPPIHVQCRCYSLPWRSEWQAEGLSGDAWAADFRAGAISELESIGRKPDNGPSPFEKAAGLPAPRAVWSPGAGLVRPSPPAPPVAPPPATPPIAKLPVPEVPPSLTQNSGVEPDYAALDVAMAASKEVGRESNRLITEAMALSGELGRHKEDSPEWLDVSRRQEAVVSEIDRLEGEARRWLAETRALMTKYRTELIDSGLSRSEARKMAREVYYFGEGTVLPKEDAKFVREVLTEFNQITNGALKGKLKTITRNDDRAYAATEQGLVNVGEAKPPKRFKEVLFHEFAHLGEDASYRKEHNQWLVKRSGGTKLKGMTALTGESSYRKEEKGLPDKFYHSYVGKYYGKAKALENQSQGWDESPTEVLSMGLEKFVTVDNMLYLYDKDKEHFALISDYLKRQRQ